MAVKSPQIENVEKRPNSCPKFVSGACTLGCPSGECRLDRCLCGQKVRVKSVLSSNSKLLHKLTTMGVVPGSSLEILRLAPLGDPMEIRTLGYRLSLRLAEAACITVEGIA